MACVDRRSELGAWRLEVEVVIEEVLTGLNDVDCHEISEACLGYEKA